MSVVAWRGGEARSREILNLPLQLGCIGAEENEIPFLVSEDKHLHQNQRQRNEFAEPQCKDKVFNFGL